MSAPSWAVLSAEAGATDAWPPAASLVLLTDAAAAFEVGPPENANPDRKWGENDAAYDVQAALLDLTPVRASAFTDRGALNAAPGYTKYVTLVGRGPVTTLTTRAAWRSLSDGRLRPLSLRADGLFSVKLVLRARAINPGAAAYAERPTKRGRYA